MKALYSLEDFGRTLNDLDDGLPKLRGRCFDIGTWGGCGVLCPAFVEGECSEPQEITPDIVIEEHGESDSQKIFRLYDCYKDARYINKVR